MSLRPLARWRAYKSYNCAIASSLNTRLFPAFQMHMYRVNGDSKTRRIRRHVPGKSDIEDVGIIRYTTLCSAIPKPTVFCPIVFPKHNAYNSMILEIWTTKFSCHYTSRWRTHQTTFLLQLHHREDDLSSLQLHQHEHDLSPLQLHHRKDELSPSSKTRSILSMTWPKAIQYDVMSLAVWIKRSSATEPWPPAFSIRASATCFISSPETLVAETRMFHTMIEEC
jgi:hypothetical protein